MSQWSLRADQRAFWWLVRGGEGIRESAQLLGYDAAVGLSWARRTGGVCPDFARVIPAGRYLYLEERIEILVGVRLGFSIRQIAAGLGRAPSTVQRELRRQQGPHYRTRALLRRRTRTRANPRGRPPIRGCGYHPRKAQRDAERAASAAAARPGKLASSPRLRERVQALLEEDYSPEQVAASLRMEFPDDPEMWVSHETIYKALYVQGRGELRRDLHRRLRTGRALRKPQRRPDERRGRLSGMVNISERPPEVEDRAVPGHWEGDLILGARSASAIGTLVERATRFVMLLHLPDDHGADAVQEAMVAAMSRLPDTLRRTLTWDQGPEMGNHVQIAEATGLDIYFCDPHSPWQRGTNENTNGLLRQYFPKGQDLSINDPGYLDYVAIKLNNRPRKTLGWRTPAQELDQLLSQQTG
jgi:IS30 family transposase